MSKLHLVIELLLQGWHVGRVEAPYSEGGPLIFRMGKSKSDYACMVDSELLWAKGVVSISHDQTDYYYKCFLLLHRASLAQLFSCESVENDDLYVSF